MTRQDQNAYIIKALEDELRDVPNVEETIGRAYQIWVQSLIQEGQSQLVSTPSSAEVNPTVSGGNDVQTK